MEEKELQDMAMHETEDSKVFQKFKERTAPEPEQVKPFFKINFSELPKTLAGMQAKKIL